MPDAWPPKALAFYQTKAFGDEAYAVRHFAHVREIRTVERSELFPEEPPNAKTGRRYYQLLLEDLQSLEAPIVSRRWRRIVFIPSTWARFWAATEINELYHGSSLEERLYAALRGEGLHAERQWCVRIAKRKAWLDFAFFCREGGIDVETDGEAYHNSDAASQRDKARDRALVLDGWRVLRYTGSEVESGLADCVREIRMVVERFGGLESTVLEEDGSVYPSGAARPATAREAPPAYGSSSTEAEATRLRPWLAPEAPPEIDWD